MPDRIPVPPGGSKPCRHCGFPNRLESAFCGGCGKPLLVHLAQARRRLVKFIADHGRLIVSDHDECTRVLERNRGSCAAEFAVLVRALEAGVPEALANMPAGSTASRLDMKAKLAKELADAGMDHSTATWAVESWALALGVHLGTTDELPDLETPMPDPRTAPVPESPPAASVVREPEPEKPCEPGPRRSATVALTWILVLLGVAYGAQVMWNRSALERARSQHDWVATGGAVGASVPVSPPAENGGAPTPSTPATTPGPDTNAPAQPAEMPREIPGADGASMVLIPAGEFMMGSEDGHDDERPIHRVSLGAFYVDRYEVTNARYAAFLNKWGREADENGKPIVFHDKDIGVQQSDGKWVAKSGYESHPADDVPWAGAALYARSYGKRLPTEAEWECACRAGSAGKWCCGDDEGPLAEYAWYGLQPGTVTIPVGQKRPNSFGLFDMHGNAEEWCADFYDRGYYAVSLAQDPQGPSTRELHVIRGGNWASNAYLCRSARRANDDPWSGSTVAGFRCVLSAGARPAAMR